MLKVSNFLDRYFLDNEYSITIKKDSVYIVNYREIIEFNSDRIVILYDGGKCVISGSDLVVSKMCDDEVLICGEIKGVEV